MNSRKGLKALIFFPLRYKYRHSKYSTTPNKCSSEYIGSNFVFYTSNREPCRNLFRGHTLLSPTLVVRLWHCLQRRYFSHWSKRNSLSEALGRRKQKLMSSGVPQVPGSREKESDTPALPSQLSKSTCCLLLLIPHPGIYCLLLFTKSKAVCKFPTV